VPHWYLHSPKWKTPAKYEWEIFSFYLTQILTVYGWINIIDNAFLCVWLIDVVKKCVKLTEWPTATYIKKAINNFSPICSYSSLSDGKNHILSFKWVKIPGIYDRVSAVVDWVFHHMSDQQVCKTPTSERKGILC
jgi:hypothetical protein